MFEIDCQKCGEMAIIFTVDLERNDVLTCDECSEVILILDDECRKQLGLKYDPNMIMMPIMIILTDTHAARAPRLNRSTR